MNKNFFLVITEEIQSHCNSMLFAIRLLGQLFPHRYALDLLLCSGVLFLYQLLVKSLRFLIQNRLSLCSIIRVLVDTHQHSITFLFISIDSLLGKPDIAGICIFDCNPRSGISHTSTPITVNFNCNELDQFNQCSIKIKLKSFFPLKYKEHN